MAILNSTSAKKKDSVMLYFIELVHYITTCLFGFHKSKKKKKQQACLVNVSFFLMRLFFISLQAFSQYN
jgi:hypothetical protein